MHDEREHPHNSRAETSRKRKRYLSGALIGPNTREPTQWVRLAGAVSLLSQTPFPVGISLWRSPTRGEERALCSINKTPPAQTQARSAGSIWSTWLSLQGTTVNYLELLS